MADDTFNVELHSLSSRAVVELFVLEYTDYNGAAQIIRYHPGTNGVRNNIVWHGDTYTPMPFKFTDMEISGQGMLPRPKISVANVGGILSSPVYLNNDLIGAKVTRKRTFVRFLDAVNFPGGINADADETVAFEDEVFYIEQKELENDLTIEFVLVSALDVSGVQIPRRQIIANTCTWQYKSSNCGWVTEWPWYPGTPYFGPLYANSPQNRFVMHGGLGYRCIDTNSGGCTGREPGLVTEAYDWTDYWELDVCAKTLAECKLRFGYGTVTPLPYGGFPGVFKVPQIG
jgi:lambda family phage minor tail protein L